MKLSQVGRTIQATRARRARVSATLALALGAGALAAPAAQAGTANAGLPGAGPNPIAHITWGVPHDDVLWNQYVASTASNQALLGELVLKPRAFWLGWENPVADIKAQTAEAIASQENGNPNVLAELATFELNPWENRKANGVDKPVIKGGWNVKSDETWYRNMAAGIGSSRTLVIEQVDLPVALKIPSTEPEQVDTYAAKVLSANKHTTLYIDAGTFGWTSAKSDAQLLIRNGIRYARGFALDDTDYDPTAVEDEFGAQVITQLNLLGVTGKHFIVDTVENGQPYKPIDLKGKGINDAPICHGSTQTVCQRTGIPPTTNVTSSRWHLGVVATGDARKYVDGYVWSGQPWAKDAGPFQPKYSLWLSENGEF